MTRVSFPLGPRTLALTLSVLACTWLMAGCGADTGGQVSNDVLRDVSPALDAGDGTVPDALDDTGPAPLDVLPGNAEWKTCSGWVEGHWTANLSLRYVGPMLPGMSIDYRFFNVNRFSLGRRDPPSKEALLEFCEEGEDASRSNKYCEIDNDCVGTGGSNTCVDNRCDCAGSYQTNIGFRVVGELPYARFTSYQVYDAIYRDDVVSLYADDGFCNNKTYESFLGNDWQWVDPETGEQVEGRGLCRGSIRDVNIKLLDPDGDHPFLCDTTDEAEEARLVRNPCSSTRAFVLWVVPEEHAERWFTHLQTYLEDSSEVERARVVIDNTLIIPDVLPLYTIVQRIYQSQVRHGRLDPDSDDFCWDHIESEEHGRLRYGEYGPPTMEPVAFDRFVFSQEPGQAAVDPKPSDLLDPEKNPFVSHGECPDVPIDAFREYVFGSGTVKADEVLYGTPIPHTGRCVDHVCDDTWTDGEVGCESNEDCPLDILHFYPMSLAGQGPNASARYLFAEFDRKSNGDVVLFRMKVPDSQRREQACMGWTDDSGDDGGDEDNEYHLTDYTPLRFWSWDLGALWGNTTHNFSDVQVDEKVDENGYLWVIITDAVLWPKLMTAMMLRGIDVSKIKWVPVGANADQQQILDVDSLHLGILYRHILADSDWKYRSRKVIDAWVAKCIYLAKELGHEVGADGKVLVTDEDGNEECRCSCKFHDAKYHTKLDLSLVNNSVSASTNGSDAGTNGADAGTNGAGMSWWDDYKENYAGQISTEEYIGNQMSGDQVAALGRSMACWCGQLDSKKIDPSNKDYDPEYASRSANIVSDKKCQDRCAAYLSLRAREQIYDFVPVADHTELMAEYGPVGKHCAWTGGRDAECPDDPDRLLDCLWPTLSCIEDFFAELGPRRRCWGRGASCSGEEYCSFDGSCGGPGDAGLCSPRPADCPDEVVGEGVCGCDDAWYPNACSARASGTDVAPENTSCIEATRCWAGARTCTDDQLCDFGEDTCGRLMHAGHCVPRDRSTCESENGPVCGCDGLYYSDECDAHLAGTDIDADGRSCR